MLIYLYIAFFFIFISHASSRMIFYTWIISLDTELISPYYLYSIIYLQRVIIYNNLYREHNILIVYTPYIIILWIGQKMIGL